MITGSVDRVLAMQRENEELTAKLAAAEQRETTAINSAKEIATTECTEGVWWAKCKNGGVYGPQATEREVLLEVAEMRHVVVEHAHRLAEQRAEGLEENLAKMTSHADWSWDTAVTLFQRAKFFRDGIKELSEYADQIDGYQHRVAFQTSCNAMLAPLNKALAPQQANGGGDGK